MKIKEKIKSSGFWVSLISSVFLILGAFGIEVGGETAAEIINGICSALVVLGIITTPSGKSLESLTQENEVTDEEVAVSEELAATEKTEKTNMM